MELKPCPFCGCEARLTKDEQGNGYRLECKNKCVIKIVLDPCPVCYSQAEIIQEDDWVEASCEECGFTISRGNIIELLRAWNWY